MWILWQAATNPLLPLVPQTPPAATPSIVDWAVVGSLVVGIVTVSTKYLIPALQGLAARRTAADRDDSTEDFREIRGTLSKIAETQGQVAELLKGQDRILETQQEILGTIKEDLSEHRRIMETVPRRRNRR